ncbi:MAG: hypothetical protein Q8O67_00310 [Deltaproteobacteria bacterium]|nr:hypothetical protein [Deltaproteobacteria bacterium]
MATLGTLSVTTPVEGTVADASVTSVNASCAAAGALLLVALVAPLRAQASSLRRST